MDIRNFFSRKRKHSDDNEEGDKPVKKKRKLTTQTIQENKKQKEEENKEESTNTNTKNDVIPSIESLEINKEHDEEKCESESESEDDDYITNEENTNNSNKNTNNTKQRIPSIALSKTKESSLKESFKYDIINECGFKSNNKIEYIIIANLFDKISSTTKRLEKIELISRLFRSILLINGNCENQKECEISLLYSLYLCCNELGPPYKNIELGIDDSIILKALCESTGRKLRDIKQEYIREGDLGLVTVNCRSKQNTLFKPKPLTINLIFETFKKIATISGSGTQQEKVRLIQKLIVASKSIESKYIVRHLQGKLRITIVTATTKNDKYTHSSITFDYIICYWLLIVFVFESLFYYDYGNKYENKIYSAPLGIILESDEHGYNTAIEITKDKSLIYESSGINIGMILSDVNGINALCLPFNIVEKHLMQSTFPIKLSFMCEKTVMIRFDYVLSAASFIKHVLNSGYNKTNIVKFLAHGNMSKLEVRSSIYLKNEYPNLLPRVNVSLNNPKTTLTNEMNANSMFSLFLQSKWADNNKLNKKERDTLTMFENNDGVYQVINNLSEIFEIPNYKKSNKEINSCTMQQRIYFVHFKYNPKDSTVNSEPIDLTLCDDTDDSENEFINHSIDIIQNKPTMFNPFNDTQMQLNIENKNKNEIDWMKLNIENENENKNEIDWMELNIKITNTYEC